MAKKEDRVVIKFGPSKYDNPKKLRDDLDALETRVDEGPTVDALEIEDIVKNFSGDTYVGTADEQIVGYGVGDVTLNTLGETVSAANSTGQTIALGDIVIVAEAFNMDAKSFIIIGIITRSGTLVPIPVPIVNIDPNFPLRTDNLPFRILASPSSASEIGRFSSTYFSYDETGLLGSGTNTIIGRAGVDGETNVNAFSLDTTISSSLFAGASTVIYSTFFDSNGRIYNATIDTPASAVYYRNIGDTVWTQASTAAGITGTSGSFTYDHSTETAWLINQQLGIGNVKFWKMGPADSTFVDMGNLGLTAWASNTSGTLIANNGWLYARATLATLLYAKPSDDSSNFTLATSTSFTFVNLPKGTVDNSGNLFIINNDASTVTKINKSTGVVSSLPTGLVSINLPQILCTQAGNFVIAFTLDEGLVGGTSGDIIPALATFDGVSSTSIIYYDDINFVGARVYTPRTSPIIEILPGTVMFYASSWAKGTFFYALTGL